MGVARQDGTNQSRLGGGHHDIPRCLVCVLYLLNVNYVFVQCQANVKNRSKQHLHLPRSALQGPWSETCGIASQDLFNLLILF